MNKSVLFVLVILLSIGCTPRKWSMTGYKTSKIAIDASSDSLADKQMLAFIQPVKQELDKEMDQVVGFSEVEMKSDKPESLLSNWTSDIYRLAASEFLKQPVDIAVVNMGSLRSQLPAGNLTVRDIFQLMPFENELVILWLKGSEVSRLLGIFAKEGGQGVSGISMEIVDGKAQNVRVGGEPLDVDKLYSIATNDFLAGGNDRMVPLATPEKRVDTGLKIRNILMEYVIRENRNGNKINAKLDGRITVR
ncbi:MAG TPA: 5'-nucleotidase C-terminal domain-containing protein [Paludibacteraceae bacterium]|nr:5'-nucleotidase C-terminal domain-containing protein [Paludibacteraceae bacterium]